MNWQQVKEIAAKRYISQDHTLEFDEQMYINFDKIAAVVDAARELKDALIGTEVEAAIALKYLPNLTKVLEALDHE